MSFVSNECFYSARVDGRGTCFLPQDRVGCYPKLNEDDVENQLSASLFWEKQASSKVRLIKAVFAGAASALVFTVTEHSSEPLTDRVLLMMGGGAIASAVGVKVVEAIELGQERRPARLQAMLIAVFAGAIVGASFAIIASSSLTMTTSSFRTGLQAAIAGSVFGVLSRNY